MTLPSIWAVVPAAGTGRRMNSVIPKQYLTVHGRPILEYTIDTLLSAKEISGLVIALSDNDQHWSNIRIHSSKPVLRAKGGKERADSVLNALNVLGDFDQFDPDEDWVMVHDAVRPCVSAGDITKLVSSVAYNVAGGLLASPVSDTVKKQDAHFAVSETIDREGLWRAMTPQYFPYSELKKALQAAASQQVHITDESSAMEAMGHAPLLVECDSANIKVTRPGDLRLVEVFLNERDCNES